MLVLAIENSTSSAKAMLYDSEKGIVDEAECTNTEAAIKTGITRTEKTFELSAAMAKKIAAGKDVAAVALCGIWQSLTVCDQNMVPQTPTYAWDYTGTEKICEEIRKDEQLTDKIYRTTGCMPHNSYPRHVITMLRQQGMDLSDKKFLTQGAYNFYRLTGEVLESCCTMSGTGLLNMESLEYDSDMLDYLGIRRDQLGDLATFEDVRPLSKEGAEALGLTPGIPVVPSHADGALNQVGNYANREGCMTLSVGTSAAIRMTAEKPILPQGRELWCYYGTDKWISGAASAGACNCVKWFKNGLLQGRLSYDELESGQREDVDAPVFLPFLVGERCPGWDNFRRGGFVGVERYHTQSDLYLGLQMGVLFNIYQCYEVLCEENGAPDTIIVSGGIANSAKWLQMCADIFERDILVAHCPNASTLGAVALALHAAGALEDIDEFRADFDSATGVSCNPEEYPFYERQYERYKKAYKEVRF